MKNKKSKHLKEGRTKGNKKPNAETSRQVLPPPPPKPPLSRITREGVINTCGICHSSVIKDGFMGMIGSYVCINIECKNSKTWMVR